MPFDTTIRLSYLCSEIPNTTFLFLKKMSFIHFSPNKVAMPGLGHGGLDLWCLWNGSSTLPLNSRCWPSTRVECERSVQCQWTRPAFINHQILMKLKTNSNFITLSNQRREGRSAWRLLVEICWSLCVTPGMLCDLRESQRQNLPLSKVLKFCVLCYIYLFKTVKIERPHFSTFSLGPNCSPKYHSNIYSGYCYILAQSQPYQPTEYQNTELPSTDGRPDKMSLHLLPIIECQILFCLTFF